MRGTADLTTKFGSYFFIKIGRGGTTALTNSLIVRISRVLNGGTAAAGIIHPVGAPLLASQTVAATATTCATADSTAGSPTLNVASVAGFAAGDVICIQDSGGGVTRLEWQRVSKTAAGILTLDDNLTFLHTAAGADTVRSKADVFAPIWVPGGSLIEAVFDYGNGGAGDTATVQCMAQHYQQESVV